MRPNHRIYLLAVSGVLRERPRRRAKREGLLGDFVADITSMVARVYGRCNSQ